MFVTEEGFVILSIEDMKMNWLTDKWEVLNNGYEISTCNEEGFTDLDEAIRLTIERSYTHPDRGVPCNWEPTSLRLYATLMKIWGKALWEKDFPNNVNPSRPKMIPQSIKTFLQEVIDGIR